MAAPVGEVTTPMQRGRSGNGFLRAGSKRPCFEQAFFELLEGELQRAEADRVDMW